MADSFRVGTTWMYKGNTYVIKGRAVASGQLRDKGFPLLIYKRINKKYETLFVRRLDDFEEKFMRCEGIPGPKEDDL